MSEFTRKAIKSICDDEGIEMPKDVLSKICELHTNSIDTIKDDLSETKKNLDKVTQERDDLKKNAPNGETVSKEEFDKIKAEYDDYKKGIEAKDLKEAKSKALDLVLKDANISPKRYNAIKKLTDFDAIELDKDGKIKNHDEYVKNYQTEYEDFVETKEVKGAKIDKPPANSSSGAMTKEDILAIKDVDERQQAIAENLNLFE